MICSEFCWVLPEDRVDLMLNHDNPDLAAIAIYVFATGQEVISP